MLRLTRIAVNGSEVTLRVEGRLVSEWAVFLERECRTLLVEFSRVRLELSAVTYIDVQGVRALDRLRAARLELENVPPLVQQILETDR